MCTVLLPPGDNPAAVNKYIINFRSTPNTWCTKSEHIKILTYQSQFLCSTVFHNYNILKFLHSEISTRCLFTSTIRINFYLLRDYNMYVTPAWKLGTSQCVLCTICQRQQTNIVHVSTTAVSIIFQNCNYLCPYATEQNVSWLQFGHKNIALHYPITF
jgi:hypothetical protein